MLRRLASTCYHRRWRVLGAWIVLLVLSFAAFGAAGEYKDEFKLPDSESSDAFDFMESHGFVNEAGFGGKIVFRAEQGVDDPAVREAMEAPVRRVRGNAPRHHGDQPVGRGQRAADL